METIVDQNVLKIWDWCLETYLQHGCKLSFPAKTAPHRTYQWRFLSKIAKRFAEWEFDDATSLKFIQVAVEQSRQAGTLRKGLAVLHQGNMLDLAYEKLQEEFDRSKDSVGSLVLINKWLCEKVGQQDLGLILLARTDIDSFRNITKWHQASKLTALYIALSKACGRAIAKLDDSSERSMLPSAAELYSARNGFLQNSNNVLASKCLLKDDWRGL